MFELVKKELNKICRRPLCLVVCIGVIVVWLFSSFISLHYYQAVGLAEDVYGSIENVPSRVAKTTEKWGLPESAVFLTGFNAVKKVKSDTKTFEGLWDNERYEEIAEEYRAFKNDPDNYTDEIDEYATMMRRMNLASVGVTVETDGVSMDSSEPAYLMKEELRYGEWQKLNKLDYIVGVLGLGAGGKNLTLDEMLPGEELPVYFDYSDGMNKAAVNISGFIGIMVALMIVAGLAPMFSEEVSRNTEPMLLSAKYGRDKLINAKIFAGFIYAAICAFAMLILNFLMCGFLYGFNGLKTPISLNEQAASVPYSINTMQYLLMLAGILFVSAIALAMVVMVISAIASSPFISVFASFFYVALGAFLIVGINTPKLIKRIYLLPGNSMVSFKLVNTVGKDMAGKITFLSLSIVAYLVFSVLAMLIIKKRYKIKM